MFPRVSAGIALCACVVSLPASAAAQERTEREVIDAIVRDGPRARAIRQGVDVVRLEQLARLAYPNPSVLYSREGAGFTEFLQIEQQIPAFGVRARLQRAGEAATAAAQAYRDSLLWQLRAEAAAAVTRVLAEQERVATAEAAVAQVSRLVEMIRVREKEGEGSRFDRLRSEQELEEVAATLLSARAALASARADAHALLSPDSRFTRIAAAANGRALPDAAEALIARAVASRAEITSLRANAAQASAEAEGARMKGRLSPTVAAGVKRATVTGDTREHGVFAGITVPVPLFDTGGRQAARWTAEESRLQAELAAAEAAVRAEVAGAFDVLMIRHGAVSSRSADTSGDDLARTAEVAYREGEIGILELLDAARTAARARLRAIELRLNTRLAEIALERAVGEIVWP